MKKSLLLSLAAGLSMAASAQVVIAPPTVDEAKAAGWPGLWDAASYEYGYVMPQNYQLVDNDYIKVVMNNGSSDKPGANVAVSGINTKVFPSAFYMGSAASYGSFEGVYDLAGVSAGIKQNYAIFEVNAKVGGELKLYSNRGKNKYTIYVWDVTANEGVGTYVLASSTHTDSYGKELISTATVGLVADHTYWVFGSETGSNIFLYEMVYTPYASENYTVKEFDASKYSTTVTPPTVDEAKAAGWPGLWDAASYDYGYVMPQNQVLVDNDELKVVMNNGSSDKPGANVAVSGINTTVFPSAFYMGSAASYGSFEGVYDLAGVSAGIKQNYAIFEIDAKKGGDITLFSNRGKNKYTIYVWDVTANEGVGTYVLASSTHTDSYGKELVSAATVGLIANHTYWVFGSETGSNIFMYAMGFNGYDSPNYSYTGAGSAGVSDIMIEEAPKSNVIYNFQGQIVDENYKGFVIKNGKKYIQK